MNLKVDLVKKIVFEFRGIDGSKLSPRCKTITRDELSDFAAAGYRMYDLSEWIVVFPSGGVSARSWRTKADALYEQRTTGGGTIRRVIDVLELL
jgi:hypothetical protein